MSTIQQAFEQVGFKHVRLRTLRRAAQRAELIDLSTFVEDVLAPIVKRRKVLVTKAGGFTKARYEGRASFVFGVDERDARSRLKTWDSKEQA